MVIVVVDNEELNKDYFGLISIWMDLDPSKNKKINNEFYRLAFGILYFSPIFKFSHFGCILEFDLEYSLLTSHKMVE